MPPDLPIAQELTLKKRARRRLVGAIALVLLMVIILPQVLQDRALLAQHEPIKISMPGLVNIPSQTVANHQEATNADIQQSDSQELLAASPEKAVEFASDDKVTKETPDAGKVEVQAPTKSQVSFTVQVGVYSDADNVKRLQEQLKQAGFRTYTEKIKTPKGNSLRLKAGNFNSRQDAVAALDKIKAIGLSGIVIGNE